MATEALLRSIRRRDIAVSAYKSFTGNANSSHLGYNWARHFSAGNNALATKNTSMEGENPKCPTTQGSYRTLELICKAPPGSLKSLFPKADNDIGDNSGRKISPTEGKCPTPQGSYRTLELIRKAPPEWIKSSSNPPGNNAIGVKKNSSMEGENPKCPATQGSYRTLKLICKATPEKIKSMWQIKNDLRGRKISPSERKVMDNIHEASPEELQLLWPKADNDISDNLGRKISPTEGKGSYRTLKLICKATPEEIKSMWEIKNDLRGRKIPPNERKVMDNIHEASPEELQLLWPKADNDIGDNSGRKISPTEWKVQAFHDVYAH